MEPARNVIAVAPTREDAIIQRRGLTTVVHDLVGIAAAMELRLEVVESALPAADSAALRMLLHQLRDLGEMMRLLKGPDGESALAPNRLRPMDAWWSLVARLAHGVIPRGVTISAEFTKEPVQTSMAVALAQIWLFACEELSGRMATPTQLRIVGVVGEGTDARVELSASLPANHVRWSGRRNSRWHQQALRIGASMDARLHWWTRDAETARWSCSLPVRAPRCLD